MTSPAYPEQLYLNHRHVCHGVGVSYVMNAPSYPEPYFNPCHTCLVNSPSYPEPYFNPCHMCLVTSPSYPELHFNPCVTSPPYPEPYFNLCHMCLVTSPPYPEPYFNPRHVCHDFSASTALLQAVIVCNMNSSPCVLSCTSTLVTCAMASPSCPQLYFKLLSCAI